MWKIQGFFFRSFFFFFMNFELGILPPSPQCVWLVCLVLVVYCGFYNTFLDSLNVKWEFLD